MGTEILLGDIVNTNAVYIARELASMGISVYHQTVVGDNPERLKTALDEAFARADLVIMTGGLGPTYDDLTKETAGAFFGRKMYMDEHSLKRIENVFAKRKWTMTENNKKQAMMPEGAIIFDNENGTAPGLALEGDGKIAVLMPGPPFEMKPMFELSVRPYLMKFCDSVLVSHTINIFGMGESRVEDTLRDMMLAGTNPTIAPYAKAGEVQLRVTASGKDEEEANEIAKPAIEKICEILGDKVYGIDALTLQNAAVKLLREKGLKAATAESCTGGMVSQRITEIPGSSEVFDCGLCTYSNEMKEKLLGVSGETLAEFGAVSKETAAEMAKGVRKVSGADIGVSVTGIAGPDGGTAEKPVGLVYVAVESDRYSEVLELMLGRGMGKFDREMIRTIASSNALSLIMKAANKY